MAVSKRKLTQDEEKALLLLKSTYEMHCKTREEALLRGKTSGIPGIDKVISEVLTEMSKIDVDFANRCIAENQTKSKEFNIMDTIGSDNEYSLFDVIDEVDGDAEQEQNQSDKTKEWYDQDVDNGDKSIYDIADMANENVIDSFKQDAQEVVPDKNVATPIVSQDDMIHNNVDADAQYDVIPLPSKGECYAGKFNSVPVGFLTAADENLITSPNLYESGNIVNILLKKKVLNSNIDVENLVSGDVDAIMVFLRGTSYGNEFPIVATDPKTGEKVETVVDLSKLKYRPFKLVGDENGNFTFKLPRLGRTIKFKFLTKKEERLLQKINKKESQGIAVFDINESIEKIKSSLKADDKLNTTDRNIIIDATKKLQDWADNLSKSNKNSTPYTKSVTNAMEMQIVSVDGITDKKHIHQFVMNMPASDSLAFRRFVYDNQPGVDFEVEVERPLSQGGGTFKCFLEWDDYVFWHIA